MPEGIHPTPRSVISRYRLEERVGGHGSSQLYRARDVELDRLVEVELLDPALLADGETRATLQRTARSVASLDHPGLVRLLEAGEEDGLPFLVWEHVSGQSLAERLLEGPIPHDDVVRLGVELTGALEAAHRAGIGVPVLAPERIRLARDGRLKLVPAGGSRPLPGAGSEPPTDPWAETMVAGTASGPAMPGPSDAVRTAIRDAGQILYEMATGRRPVSTPGGASPRSGGARPVPLLSQSGAGGSDLLDSVILKALADDSGTRYDSVAELAADLESARSVRLPAAGLRRGARWRWYIGAPLLAAVGAGVLMLLVFGRQPGLDSVAVLPLRNATGDPRLEYLADGVAEDVILRLSHLDRLRVIARSSVFQYKGRSVDPRTVGKELGVSAVLVGDVRRVGDRLRITAELVDPKDGRLLLGLRHEARADDLGALQAEFVEEVARRLRPRLGEGQRRRLIDPGQASPEARRLYLQGRQLLHRHGRQALEEAVSLFERSRTLAPGFAAAHVGLAQAYYELSSAFLPPRRVMPRSLAAARRALELDPQSGPAHVSLGAVQGFYQRRWVEAERSFRRALALAPALADAHHYFGIYLIDQGRLPEAERALRRARDLDPLSPSIALRAVLPAYYARRYPQAIEAARAVINVQPKLAAGYHTLGRILAAAGRNREALASLRKARELGASVITEAAIAQVLASSGQRERASALIERILATPGHERTASYHLALAYAHLGDPDEAFRWLDRADRERSESLNQIAIDPHADPLRNDPRFGALLERLGLALSSQRR